MHLFPIVGTQACPFHFMKSFTLDSLWGQKNNFFLSGCYLFIYKHGIANLKALNPFSKAKVNFNSTLPLTKTDLQMKDQIAQEIGNEIQWFSSLGH